MWVWLDHACLTHPGTSCLHTVVPGLHTGDSLPIYRDSLPTYNDSLPTHASVVLLEVLVSGDLSALAHVLPNTTELQIPISPCLFQHFRNTGSLGIAVWTRMLIVQAFSWALQIDVSLEICPTFWHNLSGQPGIFFGFSLN